MPGLNCSCTRRALHNVFVEPVLLRPRIQLSSSLPTWAQISSKRTTTTKPTYPLRSYPFKLTERHHANYFQKRQVKPSGKIPPPPPLELRPYAVPYDEEIQESSIALVDRDGKYHERVALWNVMDGLDRTEEHLLQVSSADPVKGKLAACKIYTKSQLRDAYNTKLRAVKSLKKAQASSKIIELNWAIAPRDLQQKLAKLETFLREGRRVEIVLASRKRQRQADVEECKDVLRQVRKVTDRVQGTKEDIREGKIGEKMKLSFSSQKMKAIAHFDTGCEELPRRPMA